MVTNDLTYADIAALLRYEAETGELVWLPRSPEMFPRQRLADMWNTRFANRPAFITPDREGYLTGKIFARTFKAHRVSWLLHYGDWPVGDIDHLNGNRADNRAANLRDVTRSENHRNMRAQLGTLSGVNGVSWYPAYNMWRVRMGRDGTSCHIGYFKTLDLAVAARRAANRHHGFTERHGALG